MPNKIISDIENAKLEVYGIEIHKDGQPILKHYFSEDIRRPIYSATKTITSAAVGLAVESGVFDINAPIYEYLDKSHIESIPEPQRSYFRKLPAERFLTMSVSGFPFRPSGEDWLEFSLKSGVDFSAEAKFDYSNISAYLVGIACENAVNEALYDYICRNIFEPLSIDKPPFSADPEGRFYGATGLYLTVNELSRIGELYLNGGVFNGKRILSEEWIKKTISKQIRTGSEYYGYFMWISEDHFAVSGKWGQKCLVYPSKKLTITYLSNLPDNSSVMLKIARQTAERL